jgi:hypothetical protein
MFHSHTLLLPLPISKLTNHNITQNNNKKYLLILNIQKGTIFPLHVSITHTIITLTNYKPTNSQYTKIIKLIYSSFNHSKIYYNHAICFTLTRTIITLINFKPNNSQYYTKTNNTSTPYFKSFLKKTIIPLTLSITHTHCYYPYQLQTKQITILHKIITTHQPLISNHS